MAGMSRLSPMVSPSIRRRTKLPPSALSASSHGARRARAASSIPAIGPNSAVTPGSTLPASSHLGQAYPWRRRIAPWRLGGSTSATSSTVGGVMVRNVPPPAGGPRHAAGPRAVYAQSCDARYLAYCMPSRFARSASPLSSRICTRANVRSSTKTRGPVTRLQFERGRGASSWSSTTAAASSRRKASARCSAARKVARSFC